MSTSKAPVADWAEIADKQEQIIMKMNNVGISSAPSTSTTVLSPEDQPQPASATTESQEEEITSAERSLLQKVIRNGLVNNQNDIEVMRKDPTSPLYSVKTFEALNLKPNILKGVFDMGFNAPSKIQETALPILLSDPPQNLIAQSQSGTGKTAAFVLAMLSRVDPTKNYPHVLCLSPTFELAMQTGKIVEKMASFCPEIKTRYAVRGEEVPRGTKLTEHIIIGTPGKVVDWALKLRFFDLKKITVFVLDEADVMVALQGHQDQSFRIYNQLPQNCQVMLFSATYEEDVMRYAERIVKNPIVMRLKREEESLDNIKQYYVMCQSHEDKYQAISNIYGTVTIGQAMIFCHTRKTAQWLAGKMTADGHAVALLSGDMTADQRISVLNRFRDGKEKVLITTNVLARGIDVEQVTIVVNYDLPVDLNRRADCETYLHRIGRTGRFGKSGLTINLVDGPESMTVLKEIENHFGRKIMQLDCDNIDDIEKLGQEE